MNNENVEPILETEELDMLIKKLVEIRDNNKKLKAFLECKWEYWKLHDQRKGISYNKRKRQDRLKQDRNTTSSCEFFSDRCYNMLEEMMKLEIFIGAQLDEILNLCSAPGGFSKKLIEGSETAKVTAVTLSNTEKGALDNLFVDDDRQKLIFDNVVTMAKRSLENLYSDLGCGDSKTDGKPKFDLALLDGSNALDKEESVDFSKEELETKLVGCNRNVNVNLELRMSEIAIASATLKKDGMLIARSIAKIQNPFLSIVWLLLKKMFEKVELYYPSAQASSSMWSQSFLYFVCRGYCNDSSESRKEYGKLQKYLEQVEQGCFDFVKDIYSEEAVKDLVGEMEKVWEKQLNVFKEKLATLQSKKSTEVVINRGVEMVVQTRHVQDDSGSGRC